MIRDKLAVQLDLLETALTRISIEKPLANVRGAMGFVDIFARDRYGNLTVIEIKRSDSAARSAIHELFKYTALLRQNYGLSPDRMRCIVVSTAWHELLVPFSEFARVAEFPVVGFRLTVDLDGTPRTVDAVKPLTEEESGLNLSPNHWAACHGTRETRDATIRETIKILDQAEVVDYVILKIDYTGTSSRVIHPFVCYTAVGRIPLDVAESLRDREALEIDDCEVEEGEGQEWAVEDAVISSLHVVRSADSVEAGWPEKLIGMLNSGWKVQGVYRHGKLSSEAIYPDDAVVRLCTQIESRNAILFSTLVRPEFRARWVKALDDLSYTLEGNSIWKKGTNYYLSEIAREHFTSSIAIHIYNPLNILVHMHLAAKTSNMNYLPIMSVVVIVSSTEVRIVTGQLSWNGRRPPQPAAVVRQVYGDEVNFLLAQAIHTTWKYEEELCRLYGFSYRLFEYIARHNVAPEVRELVVEDGGCWWRPACEPDDSFVRFLDQSESHLSKLADWFAKHSNL
jgi:hypothetical protein